VAKVVAAPKGSSAPVAPARADKKRRLSYKEMQELAGLPDRIDQGEQERSALYAQLADPAVLRDGAAVALATARLAALDSELIVLAERWEALETIASE
jgi:ABC transport system ATP-binding/permease protein